MRNPETPRQREACIIRFQLYKIIPLMVKMKSRPRYMKLLSIAPWIVNTLADHPSLVLPRSKPWIPATLAIIFLVMAIWKTKLSLAQQTLQSMQE
jgi:hypothetical protein